MGTTDDHLRPPRSGNGHKRSAAGHEAADSPSEKFRRHPRKHKTRNAQQIILNALLAICVVFFLLPITSTVLGFSIFDLVNLAGVVGALLLLVFAYLSNRPKTNSASDAQTKKLANRLELLEDQAWEIRESEEIHRSLAEAFGDVVIHRDQNNILTFSNKAYEQYFCATSTLPKIENSQVELSTRELEVETIIGTRWFTWTDMQVRDFQTGDTGWRSVARDITQQKNHEQKLLAALQKAEVANQAKSRFLATVSHEIRTPLNGVIGMAQLLGATKLDAAQKNYADAIHSSGNTLLALIEDLLNTAQIEAGQITLQPVQSDIGSIVEQVAEILSPRSQEKNLSLTTYIDPRLSKNITIDQDKLRQVLLNLVGNSVKFTQKGGVSLSVRRASQNKTEFSVVDTGPGISPQDQARVFEEFVQADQSNTRRHGGAGLGLAISKNIISLMGGEITVDSQIGKGSKFSFVLDLPDAFESAPAQNERLGSADHNLIVILPETPARMALVETAVGIGCNVKAYDSLESFDRDKNPLNNINSIVIAYGDAISDLKQLQDLRENLRQEVQLLIIGNSGEQGEITALMNEGYHGWLTWPVRAETIKKVLVGMGNAPIYPAVEAPHSLEDKPQLRILLAEDNPINALLVKSLLSKIGHTVDHVEDGEAAVETAFRGEPYDLILMDLHMPIQDGASAIEEIRGAEFLTGLAPCPIIVLSADGQSSARETAIAAGADNFLVKPLDLDSVTKLIDKLEPKKKLMRV